MDIQCHIRSFGRPETAATNQSDNLVALRGTIPFGHLGMSITVVRNAIFVGTAFFNGLVCWEIYRKPQILPLNTGLSCNISLKPIHWLLDLWKRNVAATQWPSTSIFHGWWWFWYRCLFLAIIEPYWASCSDSLPEKNCPYIQWSILDAIWCHACFSCW